MTDAELAGAARHIVSDPSLVEVGRRAVEERLIELRDARISVVNRGNGLVCRERDGEASSAMRLTTREALVIAIRAITEHLQARASGVTPALSAKSQG